MGATAATVERPAPAGDTVALVCPRCDETMALAAADGWIASRCPACGGRFGALLTTVRAKMSRGDKLRRIRAYRIRVKHGDTEDLVVFEGGADDIELRAGDAVAFLYRRDTLYVVQNLTLGATTRLRTAHSLVALSVATATTLAAIVALRHWPA